MTDIKFIGTTQVELVNSLDESNKISPVSTGENFIEFSFNTLSKDSSDFYHFVITGSNVQVSGTIDSVTTDYQFFNLFLGCSQITDASQLELTAPTMKFFCFGNMFKDCTNLINPPSVEATTLADWCYQGMFAGCNKMTSAPQLPATTLAPYCYYAMFYGCSSLTSAPYLPASTLVDWCYNSMFFNCQNLTSISASFSDWNTSGNSTKNWVTGIDTAGEIYNQNISEIYGIDNIPQNWIIHIYDYSTVPLTFRSNGSTNIRYGWQNNPPNLYYKKKNTNWKKYTLGQIINLDNGEFVSISGNNGSFSWPFVSSGSGTLICYGNPYSLTNYTSAPLKRLFSNMNNLVDASNIILSSLTLTDEYYYCMFQGCTSLTAAPALPATGLAFECYYKMFEGCTSLSTAPSLPATELVFECYRFMFSGCTSLTAAPALPATTLAQDCYQNMFNSCTSLTDAPQLPATTVDVDCYEGMFNGCTSLTKAPQLPASSLAQGCYQYMFANCTSLTEAPSLPATELAQYGYCYRGMFEGCTSLTDAPTLRASTLTNHCYDSMFKDCINLSSITVNFSNWSSAGTYSTLNWVVNVAPTGVFTKKAALTETYGNSSIPSGWTVINK